MSKSLSSVRPAVCGKSILLLVLMMVLSLQTSSAPSTSPHQQSMLGSGLSRRTASLAPIPFGGPTGDKRDVTYSMTVAVNGVRMANGVYKLLKSNKQLAAACVKHAADMAKMKKMTHTGSDRSSPAKRAHAFGYKWTAIRENVAAGQTSLVQVMHSWVKSPGHFKNILSNVNEMAAAVAQDSKRKLYWVQCFGSR